MTDCEIAEGWIHYNLNGDDDSEWAVLELDKVSQKDPFRTLAIIHLINEAPVEDENWKSAIDGALGCGPLENIIANFPDMILETILCEARRNNRLHHQLSVIYESSLPKDIWHKIHEALKTSA